MGPWCTQMTGVGWLLMIALWITVVGLVIWVVGRLFPAQPSVDPSALLDARPATGDLDVHAYRSPRSAMDDIDLNKRKAQP